MANIWQIFRHLHWHTVPHVVWHVELHVFWRTFRQWSWNLFKVYSGSFSKIYSANVGHTFGQVPIPTLWTACGPPGPGAACDKPAPVCHNLPTDRYGHRSGGAQRVRELGIASISTGAQTSTRFFCQIHGVYAVSAGSWRDSTRFRCWSCAFAKWLFEAWLEDVGIIDSLRWLGVGCKAVPKIESCTTEGSKKALQTLN